MLENLNDPNERVAATEIRDDVEDSLAARFERLLRRSHSEGLLFGLLKRVGWQGGRCTCGCEEARYSSPRPPLR